MNTAPPSTPHLEPLLQYLLENSLQQQQLTQELIKKLLVTTQELLQQLARACLLPGCLLDSRQEALCLLHKLTPADNVEMYLCTFEQTAFREGWLEEVWAQAPAPLLIRETQLAYFSLPPALAEDYLLLKEQILGCCRFSVYQATTEFHHWVYRAEINPCSQLNAWLKTTKHCLQPKQHSAMEVTKWIAMDRFLWALPPAECMAISMKAPKTPQS